MTVHQNNKGCGAGLELCCRTRVVAGDVRRNNFFPWAFDSGALPIEATFENGRFWAQGLLGQKEESKESTGGFWPYPDRKTRGTALQ